MFGLEVYRSFIYTKYADMTDSIQQAALNESVSHSKFKQHILLHTVGQIDIE